jgi:hypothetical protein
VSPPGSRELRPLQRSGCLRCDPLRVALFGGSGPFPGQPYPAVVVVLTGLCGPSVNGTMGVATGVEATVGVGITGGVETPALPVVGTVGAMT